MFLILTPYFMSHHEDSSVLSAIVALVAVIAIAGIAYYAVEVIQSQDRETVIDLNLPEQ